MGSSESKQEEKSDFDLFVNSGNLLDYYLIEEQLASGESGMIFKAKDIKFNKIRVIEEFSHSRVLTGVRDDLKKQVDILNKFDHPNIISIYEVIKSPFADYLVCEFLEGKNLMEFIFDRLQKRDSSKNEILFSDLEIKGIMKDIMRAIYYCHKHKIVHNDICPDNFVFSECDDKQMRLKLINFGVAIELKDINDFNKRNYSKYYGHINFRSPETFEYKESKYDFELVSKRDIWSAGIILFILLTGKPLVKGQKRSKVLQNINELFIEKDTFKYIKDELFQGINQNYVQILQKMLAFEPNSRYSAKNLLKEFRDDKTETELKHLNVIISNMESFKCTNSVDRQFRKLITSRIIQDDYETSYNFNMIDYNGNGLISRNDLNTSLNHINTVLTEKKSYNQIQMTIDNIMKNCDWSGDKKISYREFITTTKNLATDINVIVREISEFLNIFRNGFLTESELKTLVKGANDEDWFEFINKVDTDMNGVIDTDELRNYLINSVITK